jgi:hypothetical protein
MAREVMQAVTWLRVFSYLWIYPGLLRQIFPAWLAFPGAGRSRRDDG